MSGSTFVSSPLTEEGRSRSITIVNPLLPLCSLGPASAADWKILPRLIPVQLSSPWLILPVWGVSVQQSMIILLYGLRTDAHPPRMETRSPRLHPPAIM